MAAVAKKERFTKQSLYVHAVICESIRDEVSGTKTLVGVIPDRLTVPAFPGMFHSLAVMGWITWPVSAAPPSKIHIEIHPPGGAAVKADEMPTPEVPPSLPDTTRISMTAVVTFHNVVVVEPGVIRVIIQVDGKRYIAAGFRLELQPS